MYGRLYTSCRCGTSRVQHVADVVAASALSLTNNSSVRRTVSEASEAPCVGAMAPLGAGETSLGQSSSFGLAREAAVEATCLWLEGKYESCLETLERLDLNQMPPAGDIKVRDGMHAGGASA
eukprot:366028-Chlamydomonas_euryale.AAC.38